MMPNDTISDMKIYATALDGTPEAWGNAEKHLLCIQWHPEDFAAIGDKRMQKIYDWIAEEASRHQQKLFEQICLQLVKANRRIKKASFRRLFFILHRAAANHEPL